MITFETRMRKIMDQIADIITRHRVEKQTGVVAFEIAFNQGGIRAWTAFIKRPLTDMERRDN